MRDPNCSYSSQRIIIWHVAETLERKCGNRRTVEKRRGILPRVGHAFGECEVVGF
jgi:hypothetical protein